MKSEADRRDYVDVSPAGIKGGQGRSGREIEDTINGCLWAALAVLLAVLVFLALGAMGGCKSAPTLRPNPNRVTARSCSIFSASNPTGDTP